jgi:phosphoglycerate dehydrogenase-like enzyme
MVKIAVLDDYQRVARDCADWSSLPDDAEVSFFHDHLADEGAVAERLRDFEIVGIMRERTPFTRSLFERLPKLRLLVTTGVLNASIDVAAARDHGVTVCGTPAPGHATAELAFGLILALARNLVFEAGAVTSGGWQTTVGRDLHGATLGIIGLGRLGGRIAAMAQAADMRVIAWSQNLTAERAAECGVQAVTKEALLSQADFVTIHLKLSARTRNVIDGEALALMKPSAYLVNTSRGPIVNEDALVAALEERRIAGAALDVYDHEPLPPDHRLRRLDNLLATPHIGYVTRETYRVFYGGVVEAMSAFLRGELVRVIRPPD